MRVEIDGDDDEGSHIDANAMLLAFCSDFFEAALRDEWKQRPGIVEQDDAGRVRIRIREVSAEDVRALVDHSEGRGAGWEPPTSPLWHAELDRLLRIQGRFAMPQLREACAAALVERASSTDADWTDTARAAADHLMWDVVADALVRASNPPWRSLGALWSPGGVADDLLLHRRNLVPQASLARVLRLASFPYHGQRLALASRWWSLSECEGRDVVRALVDTSAEFPLWLPEVDGGLVLPREDDRGLPAEVLSALVRCLARTVSHTCPPPVAELRRGMAMIEATLVATAGPGLYQMALVPVAPDDRLEIDLAYVSDAVRMHTASAVYHVYLEEATRLQAWWRLHGGAPGGLHVLLAFWGGGSS